jgi:hypothetical protein
MISKLGFDGESGQGASPVRALTGFISAAIR